MIAQPGPVVGSKLLLPGVLPLDTPPAHADGLGKPFTFVEAVTRHLWRLHRGRTDSAKGVAVIAPKPVSRIVGKWAAGCTKTDDELDGNC